MDDRIALKCGWCQADVMVQAEQMFVTCDHCKASLYMDLAGQRPTYRILPGIRENDIGPCIGRWLSERAVQMTPVIREVREVLIPFWRVEHDGREDFIPAVESPYIRAGSASVPSGDREFFNPESPEGPPPEKCIRPDVPLEEAALRLGAPADSPGSLVYVPVFDVRYSLRNLTAQVIMEAVTGRVWFSDPEASRVRSSKDTRLKIAVAGVLLAQTFLAVIFKNLLLSVITAAIFILVSKAVLEIIGSGQSESLAERDG